MCLRIHVFAYSRIRIFTSQCAHHPPPPPTYTYTGGAGLIAGVAAAAKTLKPDCKVYGVEPRLAASFTHAVKEGKACVAPITPTLADGLSVPQVGSRAFEVARPLLDDTVIVEERDIALALLRLVENEKMIVEGAGATGLAACLPGGPLHNHPDLKGKTVVVPLCGGNIDTTVLGRVFDRGLAADDRLVRFVVTISDRPGGVAGLTRKLADLGVSIKDIFHERAWLHTSVDKVQIKCIIETTGKQHSEKVKASLESEGYPLEWGIKANEGKIIGSMDV